MARSQFTKHKFWLTVVLSASVVIGAAIAFQRFSLQMLLHSALLWVKSLGSTGVIAFIVIYNLATILLIPGSLLTLGGGALYGIFWGSIYVTIAAILGAIIAFLLGRYFARGWVSQQIQSHPKFQAIDTAVAREGLKIVLLTRLSPVFPFNLLNYAFGITRVSLKDYVIGSIGMIPGSVLYVYIGSLAGDLTALGMPQTISPQAQMVQWLAKLIGFLATVGVTLYITRIAKRSLNQSIAARSNRP
ncbi:TVP38/TMEM64 family protein [Myxacorys almedinensis]|uniref:TVP38/TMEM64 family membrane protein n=1 Tax=Myxacorys almedinensis A TaxID=2690445 RepID=A0A8J8CLR6_9CYAN|nr:TVP38/TMEM64 family protein [Myxacorys almedinensis]NDJ19971.1 TVP38/TMEM64 family protein [Myxacorys almedinensis A]